MCTGRTVKNSGRGADFYLKEEHAFRHLPGMHGISVLRKHGLIEILIESSSGLRTTLAQK